MEWLIPVVAFAGFFAGMAIKHSVPEEVVPGRKYRRQVEKFLLLLVALSLLFLYEVTALGYGLLVLGFLAGIFLRYPYFYLGLALLTFDFVVASLVLLYGLSYGDKDVVGHSLLFAAPFLLLLTAYSPSVFLPLAIGGCLSLVVMSRK